MSGALLRAYLEGQADLGLDEVILPYPPVLSRQGAGLPDASGVGAVAVAPRAGGEPQDLGSQDARSADAGKANGNPATPSTSGDPAGGSLFASLSQALVESGAKAVAARVSLRSRTEPLPVPDFPDLDAFWSYLSGQPGAAAGDPAVSATGVIRGQGAAGASLALVGLEPCDADAAMGFAFQGQPGALLAKMLKAIRLDAAACYKTNLVKAARATRATRRDLARLIPWLHAELALVRAPFVLLLGEACAQAVLRTGKAMDELRQEPFRVEGREFSVTYHPAELLAREELKRKAWEDLQWLQKRMAEAA